jgi:His-Xaa-Ser system protein HxsD
MATEQGRNQDDRDDNRDRPIVAGIDRLTNGLNPSIWRGAAGSLVLSVDTLIFSTDSILRAAYKWTDACYLWLERDGQSTDRCLVFFRAKRASLDLAVLTAEFSNELIDQRLREQLEQQFGQLRTLITAQAFSEGNLLDPAE